MSIQGIHHITLICADAQRTVDFYTGVLGQRLVKQTVNFDDPGSYHLYFGDEAGTPGTVITFFEWRNAPKGSPGIGGTHHFAMTVADEEGLLKWKRRLSDLGYAVKGPYDRHYFRSIYFNDPDGVNLEIATAGPGFAIDEEPELLGMEQRPPPPEMTIANRDENRIREISWGEPVPEIGPEMALRRGMHHITAMSSDIERTHQFFTGVLGLRRVKMTDNFDLAGSSHWYWGVDGGRPGSIITYFGYPARYRIAPTRMGVGQTHHFALSVATEEIQLAYRDKLIRAGYRVSPVMDRSYFKSIYTNDPDGHIVELATLGPGFATDESAARLGQALKLPPWLEKQREYIEGKLTPLTVKPWPEQENKNHDAGQ